MRAPTLAFVLLPITLLALSGGRLLAEPAFLQCHALPESPGPFGDGSVAGELFGIYAAEINPDVLVFPDIPPREDAPPPMGFDLRQAAQDPASPGGAGG